MKEYNLKELGKIQKELSKKIILRDELRVEEIKTIAGVDVAYLNNRAFVGIAIFAFPEIEMKKAIVRELKADFPYIPGFLGFREAIIVADALKKLKKELNMIMIDAHGIAHPRCLGAASHAGLLLDMPSIGVAKKLLCGEIKESKIILKNKVVGMVLRNEKIKKGKTKFREVYVSPGHKISLESAVKITKASFRNHRLPEPLHAAHRIATKAKKSEL